MSQNNPRGGANNADRSGMSEEDRSGDKRSIRWRVIEVGPTNDVDAHYSDEYNLVLDPINIEFKFRLVFKVRTDHFELYIESLIERDVDLKLQCASTSSETIIRVQGRGAEISAILLLPSILKLL